MHMSVLVHKQLSKVTRATLVGAIMALTSQPMLADQPPSDGQWRLADLYPSDAAWDSAYTGLQRQLDQYDCDAAALTNGVSSLSQCLDQASALRKTLMRLSTYAGLSFDNDLRNNQAQERVSRIQALGARVDQRLAFIEPTLAHVPVDKLTAWASEPALAHHRHQLQEIIIHAPHLLPVETESALAALAPVLNASDTSYQLLSTADIEWPTLTIRGKPETIDQNGFVKWRADPDPKVRKQVFDAFFGTWKQFSNTAGSLLATTVNLHVTDARLRHYHSAREAALAENDIPVTAYAGLLKGASDHLDTFQRYLKLRKRMMGLKALHYYDLYPSISGTSPTFTLSDARSLLARATQPLGPEYANYVREVNNAPWTSAYPARAKATGAFETGAAYDVHPYVLLSFNGDYESVSTYVHEWGHGIHTLLANKAQPFETSQYPIFLAEIASTTNEQLLVDYMIAHAKTRESKLFYLVAALDNLKGTFFRQAQFAQFESDIHAAQEQGQALSAQRMTDIYAHTLNQYYGVDKGITQIDPVDNNEWAYIPHFYYDFYVYQYATSITAASYFATQIEAGNRRVRDAYLNMLRQGSSQNPFDLLKRSGVDLASPGPYAAVAARMNRLMDQIETILEAQHTHTAAAG